MSERIDKIMGRLKEFKLTSLAVDNATTIFLLTFMVLLFGLRSYQSMLKEQFSEVSFTTVIVNTPDIGNSDPDIEDLITRPLEKEINTILGLERMTSTSIQDFSVITVEFAPNVDLDE